MGCYRLTGSLRIRVGVPIRSDDNTKRYHSLALDPAVPAHLPASSASLADP